MPTETQKAASRANGAKSRGPRTAQGKQWSSRNPLQHGFRAQSLLITGEESENFHALRDQLFSEFSPRTFFEARIVESAVLALWRLDRLQEMEAASTNHEILHQPEGPTALRAARAFTKMADTSRILDFFHRYETRFDRQFYRALTQLSRLRLQPNLFATLLDNVENALSENVNLPSEPQISLETLASPSQVPRVPTPSNPLPAAKKPSRQCNPSLPDIIPGNQG